MFGKVIQNYQNPLQTMPTALEPSKFEIISRNKAITILSDEIDAFEIDSIPCKPILITKVIPCNRERNISTKQNQRETTNKSLIEFFCEESMSTIPIFMKYFAFHELLVLICGGLYHLEPNVGALLLSIIPGISIISIFIHFLLTQFNQIKQKKKQSIHDTRNISEIKLKIKQTYFSIHHYLVAISVFIIGLLSIFLIYQTNTYLSTLVPIKYEAEEMSDIMVFIGKILKFPHSHSMQQNEDLHKTKPFNYRISFVGSIIAPIIEESFKFLLVSLTFPIGFIWGFAYKRYGGFSGTWQVSKKYSDYCIESLFIMFIAVCGGCGIAIMENIGYLAACQWERTRSYCLPNKNFDILGAGLARGIFSVPFHCVTACIMADILCIFMQTNCLNKNKCAVFIKFILSYPVCIIMPVFLHSSFNYWMKGLPFMTGIVTVVGFSFLTTRIAKKYAYITGYDDEEEQNEIKEAMSSDIEANIDTITDTTAGIDGTEIGLNETYEPQVLL